MYSLSLTGSIAVYVIIWWVVFFMVLPFGTRRNIHSSDVQEGHDPGSVIKPQIKVKMVITTIISFLLFAVFYYTYTAGLLDFYSPQ